MAKYRVEREPVVQPPDQSIRLIPLTKGQVTVVDASDYDWLMQWSWNAYWHPRTKSFYARRNHIGTHMQRIIMEATPGQLVDHHDGDTLNNRRSNLRLATCSQNSQNRKVHSNNKSGHPGIFWRKDLQRWAAQICVRRNSIHLGMFDTIEEAVAARDLATAQHFGEFARVDH